MPAALPIDDEAERAVIGACLISDIAIEQAAPLIDAADFARDTHAHIWTALIAVHATGARADVFRTHRAIPAGVTVDVTYLHELQNDTPSISNAAVHARAVADARVRRKLIHAAADITALATGNAPADDAADAVDKARTLLADIDMPTVDDAPDLDVDTWLADVDQSYDWLLPGFLERRDRLLVTAGEGMGKSVFLAQLAFQAAAGVHPWTRRHCAPCRVLVIDCENGDRLVARRFTSLRAKVPAGFDPARLRYHGRPRGIDITTSTDRRWLIERIRANRPDLLVIGPAYKLTRGEAARNDIGGEERAKATVDLLDDLRERFGIALLMETHAPHGGLHGRDLRPFGSSVWLRWPEFGIGFSQAKDTPHRYTLHHWRGPRDQRTWPQAIERGGFWPWTPIMPDGTFSAHTDQPPVDLYDDEHLFEEAT